MLWQDAESAELPDDKPVQWAPMVPYSGVLWRSGVALAREVAQASLGGVRVVELGCGMGVPSLAAARVGATVLATDEDPYALELLERNARENGLGDAVETARVEWAAADALVARGPFDLVLASDVLYELESVALLLSLLPRLSDEIWLADPDRHMAGGFFDQAERIWRADTITRNGIGIHRLISRARSPSGPHRRLA